MTGLFTMIFRSCAIILLVLLASPAFGTSNSHALPRIDLAISFDIENKLIRGTSKIQIDVNEALTLYLPDLKVTSALLSTPKRENGVIDAIHGNTLAIEPTDDPQTLLISYEKKIEKSFDNLLLDKAIVLTSGWHPIPDTKARFSLTARVPEGFTALTQADRFDGAPVRGGSVHFSFSQPQHAITFIAAPYVVKQRTVRDGLSVYSLFFDADKDLADGYLDAAADYIRRYETLIGEFPYNHYVIAENIMPTGYGFPTFTLLGQQVIRLPFIKQTSLGHEILHSWFGNSIDIADDSGNWCEGLTTYLADMAYREDKGEGIAARKEAILTYHSYINDTVAGLGTFRGAGHERAANRALRAVGYQKSAMLFHELKQRIGADAFNRGLREFYRKFRGNGASWKDLRLIFEDESEMDLQRFFSERLMHNQSPELAVENVEIERSDDATTLALTISQLQEQPYELLLPVSIETVTGSRQQQVLITDKQETVSIASDGTPLALVIDAEYDLLRTLSSDEDRPVWSKLLGTDTLLIKPSDTDLAARFEPLLGLAGRYGWKTETGEELTSEDIETNTILFLDVADPHVKKMFGFPGHPAEGFTLDIRVNPFNEHEVVGLISSSSLQETMSVLHRLPHYGKYSYLHFKNGRSIDKRIAESANGIRVELENQPTGVALNRIKPFESLIDELATNRVVYIGETHTSRPDHLLQLMLIEALHKQGRQLAIGMEMFPRTSQPALDRYINDQDFSEAEFLTQARYFSVWGYDYRLFRPIFDFARKHKIPLIGLNVEREIVSSVFKNGSFDTLSEEQIQTLPSEMQLDMPGYIERLRATHQMHLHGKQTEGNFSGFIQAQALWDETMAATIAQHLQDDPDTSMVVLAGSQHTRKDSGIPPRVARRIDVAQASVLNSATNFESLQDLSLTTDYLFFFDTYELVPQGKIGVILEEKMVDNKSRLKISGLSPQSNSETAGLITDDLLIFIDEFTIHNMVDVKLALLDRKAGESVNIGILRSVGDEMTEMSIPVKLYHPTPLQGHP